MLGLFHETQEGPGLLFHNYLSWGCEVYWVHQCSILKKVPGVLLFQRAVLNSEGHVPCLCNIPIF